MQSIKSLENDLYWQKYVLANSKNPIQKKRVQDAINRLQAQIDNLRGVQS